jgi:hypothetical protein
MPYQKQNLFIFLFVYKINCSDICLFFLHIKKTFPSLICFTHSDDVIFLSRIKTYARAKIAG